MMGKWVTEVGGGYGQTIEVRECLLSKQSKFQKIEIYETVKLGRLLLLDGIIQLTDSDEFVYHEMLANLPSPPPMTSARRGTPAWA